MRVLLVEDDADLSRQLKAALGDAGYAVDHAPDGEEAHYLGENEPFDFLTWFEYSPSDETAFNRLLAELRASVEWQYVDREIDIRLVHEPA